MISATEVEAERQLLGAVLAAATCAQAFPGWAAFPAAVRAQLQERDLQDVRLQHVYRAIGAVLARGEPATPLSAAAQLLADGVRHTDLTALLKLEQDATPVLELAQDHLRRVLQAASDRRARLALSTAAQATSIEDRRRLLLEAQVETDQRGGRAKLPITWLDQVQPEQLQWFWQSRIPRGCITLLVGDPGQGKSALSLHLAAVLSRGWMLPGDQQAHDIGTVMIVAHEDPVAQVLVPRLEAAGADRAKVAHLKTPCTFPGGIPLLEETLVSCKAKLVIIDPIAAYLDSKLNGFSDQELRSALAPIQQMAERTGAAIVVVAHMNKGSGRQGLYRVGGSIALVGQARSALLVAPDPQNPDTTRVLAPLKQNLTKAAPSLAFSLVDTPNGCPRIEWIGESKLTAEQLLSQDERSKKDPQAMKNACDALRAILAGGPLPAVDVEEQLEASGVTEATMKRARKRLRIVAERRGGVGAAGKWWWRLPTEDELAGGRPRAKA